MSSSKIIDPILLLRDYTMKEKKVRLDGEELAFGITKVPLSAPTAWKSGFSEKHYTMGALWFYLANRGEELRKYASEAMRLKIEIISQPDKEAVVDYFTGKTDRSESIDEDFRAQTMVTKYKRQKSTLKKPEVAAVPKPPLPGEEPMQDVTAAGAEELKEPEEVLTEREKVLDYLRENEKRILTRHTQLLGSKVRLRAIGRAIWEC